MPASNSDDARIARPHAAPLGLGASGSSSPRIASSRSENASSGGGWFLPALRAIKLPENGRETNARTPRNRADHNGAATQRQATDFNGKLLIFNTEN
jgi:hypothetical protein